MKRKVYERMKHTKNRYTSCKSLRSIVVHLTICIDNGYDKHFINSDEMMWINMIRTLPSSDILNNFELKSFDHYIQFLGK